MKLREYQVGTKNLIIKSLKAGNQKIIVFGPTGSGKTVIAVNIIEGILKKGNRAWFIVDSIELIEQAVATLENFGIYPGVMQGQHEKTDISKPVQVMTAQTLTRRWMYFDSKPEFLPDLIIIDECFTGDTEILTAKGTRCINKVRVGDIVYNATGTGFVSAISTRKSKVITIGLSNGKSIRCTKNHPFFTREGWVNASKLGVGRELISREELRNMWERDEAETIQDDDTIGIKFQQIKNLLNILLKEAKEPYALRNVSPKNESIINKSKTQATTRWKWEAIAKTTSGIIKSLGSRMGSRIPAKDRSKKGERLTHSDIIQNRHIKQGANDCNRSGWRFSFFKRTTKIRQEKGFNPEVIRVVSVSSQEQGCKKVYNLQVTGHPSYYAEGMLVHNCHVVYKAHKEIFDQHTTKHVPVLGFTATPYTRGLAKLYDDLVVGTSTAQLTEEGHLVPVIVYGCEAIDTKGLKTDKKGDYLVDGLAKRATKITGDIVRTWKRLGETRQTLVYCVNVAHSKEVAAAFATAEVSVAQIDGNTPAEERSTSINGFKQGVIKVLVSVGTLVKGFDAPIASCLVMARPTKSKMLHFQILGRVLRPCEGKTNAIILDHGGSVAKIGFPDENIPDVLDDGTKGNSGDRPKKDKPESKKCPNCGQILKSLKCSCGFVVKPPSNVENESGELKKLSAKDRRNKTVSHEDKQAFYSGALQYCHYNEKAEGHAAQLYRSRFGVWPNNYVKVRKSHIPDEVMNQVKANNIRWANRRK